MMGRGISVSKKSISILKINYARKVFDIKRWMVNVFLGKCKESFLYSHPKKSFQALSQEKRGRLLLPDSN